MKIIKRILMILLFTILFAIAGYLILGFGATLFTHPSDENDFTSVLFGIIGLLLGAIVGFIFGVRRGSKDLHLIR